MTPSTNSGKLLTKRIRASDGTTLVLRYRKSDADEIRAFASTTQLKGNHKPSLALIARRAMALYMARVEMFRVRPELLACEIAELERMCTPVPQPAKKKPA